jgi:hypothetical protein
MSRGSGVTRRCGDRGGAPEPLTEAMLGSSYEADGVSLMQSTDSLDDLGRERGLSVERDDAGYDSAGSVDSCETDGSTYKYR